MRIGRGRSILVLALALLGGLRTLGQNPDLLSPEDSSARAQKIVGQLIAALGGPAYLGMSQRQCDGRRALIGHTGELSGYVSFKDSWQFPDKNRIDYIAHARNTLLGYMIGVQGLEVTHGGQVIMLFDGDRGWILDRSGVSELPGTSVAEFQEALRESADYLLRYRLKEEGINYRWGGLDTVDLRQVDWVEISGSDQRTIRLAVDRSTHLLVRSMVVQHDEELNQPRVDVKIYTNYQLHDGVQMPMQVTSERDGRRTAQLFYENCHANPTLPGDFFTPAALEKRHSESGSKGKPDK